MTTLTSPLIEELLDTQTLPIVPLKGMVVYPYLVVPLIVQQPEHARMVDEALMRGVKIGLFQQRDPKEESPGPDGLYTIGASGNILKMLRFPDGTVRFLIQGLTRIRARKFFLNGSILTAEVEELEDVTTESLRLTALQRNLMERIKTLVDLAPYLNEEFHVSALNQDTPSKLTDFVASNLNISPSLKQELLEEVDVLKRMQKLYTAINKEIEVLELSQKIQAQAASELGKSQRDFILREQLKAIRRELGESDEPRDLAEFEKKIAAAKMPEHAEKVAIKELDRLSHMNSSSAEYTVSRTYLDWLVNLPWSLSTEDVIDLRKAKKVLDEDHYDLEKVKERILEFLAVRKLNASLKGPILCFVGPPGVGKTSLGKSIARAMGRQFVRVSLGGMRDEAEIRGHRRTYIGAQPGRIIQSLKRSQSNNPIIVLDEIDKLGADFRGDPASALLEVLDPEQNDSFSDHYMEIPFDLSKVMFITTANWAEPIPPVLRDRMEIIQIPGYSDHEKLMITRRHLIRKQIENHGLTDEHISFTDDGIKAIIDGYTREAGLRNLEREIASVTRKVARMVASGGKKKTTINADQVGKLLGPPKFTREVLSRTNRPGVVPGLAYTSVGGELLFIEVTAMEGKTNLILTGQLGSVMKESAQAALSFVRANAAALGIPARGFDDKEIHIHVPSGSTPKDGPSAGITIAVALASLFTNRPVKPQMAMTGEITLRGDLLPIGGLKEKLLAAVRAGVTSAILPEQNRRDLIDVNKEITSKLAVKHFSDVLTAIKYALEPVKPVSKTKGMPSTKKTRSRS